MDLLRPTVFFLAKNDLKVAIIKAKSASIAFLPPPPSLFLRYRA